MTSAERYVVSARLRKGRERRAEKTLLAGPPFDPGEAGLDGHAAYLGEEAVYLVFEGEAARAKALRLARRHLAELGAWEEFATGLPEHVPEVPRDARPLYRWRREGAT